MDGQRRGSRPVPQTISAFSVTRGKERTAPRLPPRPANHQRLFRHEEKGTDSAAAPALLGAHIQAAKGGSGLPRPRAAGGKKGPRALMLRGAARGAIARRPRGGGWWGGRERRRRAGERRGGERPQELGRSRRRGRGGHGRPERWGGAGDVWVMCGGCRVGRSARWPEFEGKRPGRGAQVARLRRWGPIRSPASALWPAAPCRPSPSGPQRGAGRRAASRAPFRA